MNTATWKQNGADLFEYCYVETKRADLFEYCYVETKRADLFEYCYVETKGPSEGKQQNKMNDFSVLR